MKFILLILISIAFNTAHGQNEKRFSFLGISPGITVEPYYDSGELDINILPIVYQRSMTRRIDLRLASTINYGIRNGKDRLSHIGLEIGAPTFLKKKEDYSEISKGFFVAPIVSISRNNEANHTNIGAWIEPGYNILFENQWALSLGLQFGGTYFIYDHATDEWGNHFGVIVTFGKWF